MQKVKTTSWSVRRKLYGNCKVLGNGGDADKECPRVGAPFQMGEGAPSPRVTLRVRYDPRPVGLQWAGRYLEIVHECAQFR